MGNLGKKEWWVAALTRALKTFCQAAITLIGTGAIGIIEVDWINVLSVSGLTSIVSLLTSIAGLPEVKLNNILNEISFDSTKEGE